MSPSTPRPNVAAGAIPEGEPGLRLFACERCSRRKQRCDRVLPVCGPCRNTPGAICERSRREEGVVRGRDMDVVRKGVVTTLLERIATLEREAAERSPSAAEAEEESRSEPGPAPVESVTPGSGRPGPPVPDSGMNISLLSLSAMAEPRSRQGEFLKQLSVARLVASVTETYGGSPESTSRADPLWDGISRYIRDPVSASHRLHIPRREADKALATYLDLVDFRYPRLRVDKVRAGFDAVSAEDDGKYKEVLEKDPAHVFMAYAVVAIVPLVSDGYPIGQGSWVSMHLLGKCLKVLDRVFRQEDGVDVIQCLQLLVILSIHCSAAGSAWHLVGFAMNKCIALGYHREDPKSAAVAGTTAEELQQRRWAFWGCYWLDRLVCAALGRPFSIDDQDIAVPLPDAVTPAVPGAHIGGSVVVEESMACDAGAREASYIHLFRHAILLSSVTDDAAYQTNPGRDSGRFELDIGQALDWHATMPSHGEPAMREIHLYQTSLFNTLCLRVAVKEILCGYTFNESDGTVRDSVSSAISARESEFRAAADERKQAVASTNLANICRSVAQSFSRTRMVGRNYLSFLTGYSALFMGLACLYCMVAGEEVGGAALSSSSHGKMPLGEALSVALQKMDIVGRQFPKIHEYRKLLEEIHSVVRRRHLVLRQPVGHTALDDGNAEEATRRAILDIGPRPLRQLAQVIIYISTQ